MRHFSGEPVPFALVENAVRAAASAPGANRQPWRFVVASDRAVKREIRQVPVIEKKPLEEVMVVVE